MSLTNGPPELLRQDSEGITEQLVVCAQHGDGSQCGETIHHGDASRDAGLMGTTLSSEILSLPDLAERYWDDPGASATLFNLTNVSSIYDDNKNYISTIVGNRKFKKNDKMYARQNNLIKVKCSKPIKFSQMPTFAVVNSRSLFPKMAYCVQIFDSLSLDVMAICETWEKVGPCLDKEAILQELSGLHGIEFLGQPRTNCRKSRGGGCGILYRKSKFNAVKVPLALPKNLELICVFLTPTETLPAVKKHILLVHYHPPGTTKSDTKTHLNFIDTLLKDLVKKYPIQQNHYVYCGDLNSLDHQLIIDFFPNFSSLNDIPTRKRRVLDYFLTSHGSQFNKPRVIAPLCHGMANASDHSIILVGPRPTCQVKDNKKIIFTRPIRQSSKINFAEFLSRTDWKILNSFSPDDCAIHLQNILQLAMDDFFPLKQSTINSDTNKPWFTFKLKLLKNKRYNEYIKSGNSEIYQSLDKEYKKEISLAKSKFKDDKVKNAMATKDFKQVFKNIRLLAGMPSKKENFILPGDEFKTSEQIAEELSIYFCKISQEYEPIDRDNLPERVKLKLDENCVIPQISEDELLKILSKMRKTSSTVIGDIPPNIKDEFLDLMCPIYTQLVNNCLRNTTFPDCYKLETCIVIPKISPPQKLDDLRNLGLTQFSSKVLEAVIIHYLMPFIEKADDTAQFGGKKNLSCTHYLLELLEFIIESFETPDCAVIIALMDFSKGFNRLSHSRLLCTLADLGIPGYLLLLILSYLTHRRMKVKYGDTLSKEKNLPGGSPQGGLLSVILFCLYTLGSGMSLSGVLRASSAEELPALPQGQPMREADRIRLKYIDDTTLGIKVALSKLLQLKEESLIPEWMFEDKSSRQLTNYEMTTDRNALHSLLEDMEKFVDLNLMKINEKKTKTMFFNNKQKDGEALYQCKGKQLEQVESYKVLGYHLQSNLRASEHVDKMIAKVNHKLWSLRILMQNCNDFEIGKQFHVTWIVPVLEYCAPVWHGILTQKQSDKLEAIQKKALRIILRKRYLNYDNALDILKLKPLHLRRKNLCLKFVHKTKNKLPSYFPLRDQRDHGTRRAKLPVLHVPVSKYKYTSNLGKRFLTNLYNGHLESESYPFTDWN